ncbi:MAG: PIN domain-containing protein [Sphingomonadales bacterium]
MEDHVLPEFAERTLPVDVPVALRCAALHVPDPRPERDACIAATALVHGMTVVTRNCGFRAARGLSRQSVVTLRKKPCCRTLSSASPSWTGPLRSIRR